MMLFGIEIAWVDGLAFFYGALFWAYLVRGPRDYLRRLLLY